MQHYLFVHFREKTSPDGEQVHFAVSRDGFHWQALNGGHPVLWAYYGDRGVRDMTIVRDHTSGKFHIFATDLSLSYGMRNQYQHSWRNIGLNGSRDLAHWVSDDLVHWSEEEMVRFGTDDMGCVWAPDVILTANMANISCTGHRSTAATTSGIWRFTAAEQKILSITANRN